MSVTSSTIRAVVTRSFKGTKYLWHNRASVVLYIALLCGKRIQANPEELPPVELGDFAEHYNTHIKPVLALLEDHRIKVLRQIRLFSWICLLLIIALMCLVLHPFSHDTKFYGMIILPTLIAFNIMILARIARSYVTKLKEELLPKILIYFSDDLAFIERPDIEISSAFKYGIIPEFYRYTIEDALIGKYQNVEFNLFEAELIKRAFVQNEEYDKLSFKGIISILEMKKKFNGQTIVKHQPQKKHIFEHVEPIIPPEGMEIVQLEDPTFEKNFEVFSTNQVEARYLLTPSFMENLLNLHELFGGTQLQCSFLEEKFFLMIDSPLDYFDPGSILKQINFTNDIKPLFDEVSLLLKIITTLKLNQDTKL